MVVVVVEVVWRARAGSRAAAKRVSMQKVSGADGSRSERRRPKWDGLPLRHDPRNLAWEGSRWQGTGPTTSRFEPSAAGELNERMIPDARAAGGKAARAPALDLRLRKQT